MEYDGVRERNADNWCMYAPEKNFREFKKKWLNYTPFTWTLSNDSIHVVSHFEYIFTLISIWNFDVTYIYATVNPCCRQLIPLNVSQFIGVAFIYILHLFFNSSTMHIDHTSWCVWAWIVQDTVYLSGWLCKYQILNYPIVRWFNESASENALWKFV